jgi:hypothetical protein
MMRKTGSVRKRLTQTVRSTPVRTNADEEEERYPTTKYGNKRNSSSSSSSNADEYICISPNDIHHVHSPESWREPTLTRFSETSREFGETPRERNIRVRSLEIETEVEC